MPRRRSWTCACKSILLKGDGVAKPSDVCQACSLPLDMQQDEMCIMRSVMLTHCLEHLCARQGG